MTRMLRNADPRDFVKRHISHENEANGAKS